MTIVVDGTMHSALLSESGDEAWIEKDFGAQRRGGRPGQSSFLRTVINITKCFVGAASFELPWAFSKGGLVGSMVGVLGLALMSSFSLGRLAECPNFSRCGSTTYPELGREAFGDVGFALAWFGTIAMTLGVCGSYFVFISQTLHELTGAPTLLMLLGTLLFVGLLSWLKRLKTLAFTSALGVGALVLAVTVVTVHAAEPRESATPLKDLPRFEGLSNYGLFLGNAAFLYLCSTAILPLAQDLEAPRDFPLALNSSIAVVTALNVAFATFAWARYSGASGDDGGDGDGGGGGGQALEGNVVDNLPAGAALTVVVKTALVVDLLFTSVVFLLPVNQQLEEVLCPGADASAPRVRAQRLAFAAAVAAVAYACPSFELLTGLTGGFGNNILGFVLPPVMYWKLRRDSGRPVGLAHAAALALVFLFGVGFLVFSTVTFVDAIRKSY